MYPTERKRAVMKRRAILVALAAAAAAATAVLVPVAGSASAGGGGTNAATSRPASSSVCTDTFTKGTGNAAISFCVTATGNIVQLSFKGVEQIRNGNFFEGYNLCVGGVSKAFDYADGGESGWNAPTRTQPGGPNTLPLTITRTTTDGSISMAQTFSFTTDSVTVSAAFKNLTAATIVNVKYIRWVDLDANGVLGNDWSRAQDSVSA